MKTLVTLLAVAVSFAFVGCKHDAQRKVEGSVIAADEESSAASEMGEGPAVPVGLYERFDATQTFAIGRLQLAPWTDLEPFVAALGKTRAPQAAKAYLATLVEQGPIAAAVGLLEWEVDLEELEGKLDTSRDFFFHMELDATQTQTWQHLYRLGNSLPRDDSEVVLIVPTMYVPSNDPEGLAEILRRAEGDRGESRIKVRTSDGFVVVEPSSGVAPTDVGSSRQTPARALFEEHAGVAALWVSGTQLRVALGMQVDIDIRQALVKPAPRSVLRWVARSLAIVTRPSNAPIEYEDHAFVLDASDGVRLRTAHTHTAAGGEIAKLAQTGGTTTLPTPQAPAGTTTWFDAAVALNTGQLAGAFGESIREPDYERRGESLAKCVGSLTRRALSLNAAIVQCVGSWKGMAGVSPTAGRLVAWRQEEDNYDEKFALVLAVRGDVTAEQLQAQLGEDTIVTERADDLLVFSRSHPEAELGPETEVTLGTGYANLDLSVIPKWTDHRRASAFEVLRARYRTDPVATYADVQLLSDSELDLPAAPEAFDSVELPTYPCHEKLRSALHERDAMMTEMERTPADERPSFIEKRTPAIVEKVERATKQCEEQDPDRVELYREQRGLVHFWEGLLWFTMVDAASAGPRFERACNLVSTLTCELHTEDDIPCPAPLMTAMPTAARDITAGTTLDESMVEVRCNANSPDGATPEQLPELLGRKVTRALGKGEPLDPSHLERPLPQ